MIFNSLVIIISIVLSGLILVLTDWRWRMLVLAVIQLIGFIFILQIWPIALASVKLISGWMGVALMSATMASSRNENFQTLTSARVFKLMLAAFSWIVIAASIESLNSWLPISYTNLFVGLVFFFCGIFYFSLVLKLMRLRSDYLIFLVRIRCYILLVGRISSCHRNLRIDSYFMSIISSYLQGGFSLGGFD